MESYYAKIENDIVVHVEVVTDDFFNNNPQRYTGIWKKVGTQTQKFIGKGAIFMADKNLIIERKPFNSFILDEIKQEWISPVEKPNGHYYWDEKQQKYIEVTDRK